MIRSNVSQIRLDILPPVCQSELSNMQFYLDFNLLYPYLVATSSLTPAKCFLILLNRQTHAEFGMSHALMRPLLALSRCGLVFGNKTDKSLTT